MNASLGRQLLHAHPGTDFSGQPLPRPEGPRTATREIRISSESEPAASGTRAAIFLDYDPSKAGEGPEADEAGA
eukprot:4199989-Pyramimonas_sp.AAC.1